VIPVEPKDEPRPSFQDNVRSPGERWLATSGLDLDQPVPEGTTLPTYWRASLDDLHASYGGVCAYLCFFIERVGGGVSVDHFVAKSRKARLVYEWSNYRLACMTMNARKRDYEDVLDPFSLAGGTFHLELVTGAISPNPTLTVEEKARAQDTIDRLGLDEGRCREMRARHYRDCRQGAYTPDFLRRHSPFVWHEANRQGLL
jgi:uncharacterized protein (TIGR02646 family)